MQECRQAFHTHENSDGKASPCPDADEDHHGVGRLQADLNHRLLPEDLRELSVSQGKSPQTQVGGGVGDAAQHVLDGVNHLMHHLLPKVKLLAMSVSMSAMSSSWSELRVVLILEAVTHLRLLLVLPLKDVGLWQQEAGHSNHRTEDQEDLKAALSGDDLVLDRDVSNVHEHLDERVEEGRRRLLPHDTTSGRRLAGPRVEDGRVDESVVAEHVGLHDEPVLVLVDGTTSGGSVALHAPHVTRKF
mmetsp:Transcript_32118/g.102304  ORF Transcript_32118/g.102304 Transcript_32118/m.102304 type:complete len:245 (-) Transcript_32118:2134-2868(-)